ncbi:uncharacterized protein METZ01_LOCUS155864, partial [marine metagenome]
QISHVLKGKNCWLRLKEQSDRKNHRLRLFQLLAEITMVRQLLYLNLLGHSNND